MDINTLNNHLLNMWENEFKNDKKALVPLLYDTDHIIRNGILFVGLNPSFSLKGFKVIFKNSKYKNIDPNSYFLWKNFSKSKIDGLLAMERLTREKYAYFIKCADISEFINIPWEHIDILFYRETNQNSVKRGLISNNNVFVQKQIQLFYELLQYINPKIIVVINALASNIISNSFGSILSPFNENVGYKTIHLNGLDIPIFFSGMLSGQRALDNGSYERLRWHIKQATKQ